MKVLNFKCTLLTDIILNRKAATQGPNETLDFIPGGNFLGIVAAQLYSSVSPEEALRLFHSGKVRFGDAHPSIEGFRSLKVPATMFYPKLGGPDEELYISNRIPDPTAPEVTKLQLKQCRNGFYDFSSEKARLVKTGTNFAVKSAHDKFMRRSKDEQMFGYQSLQKGMTMYFSVEVDDDINPAQISDALIGKKRIGRSRSAQYGLVDIAEARFDEVKGSVPEKGDDLVTVYADGRLIFLDDNGAATFRPDARQLGLNGEIMWNLSQIRTFRYAPWNYKRQYFDTDRCGFEKGSVFVVKLDDPSALSFSPCYVGAYKNEGFGKVIYNPGFLKADAGGRALCRLDNKFILQENTPDFTEEITVATPATPLVEYLLYRKNTEMQVYGKVNDWVKANAYLFRDETFASQWGQIRSLATHAENLTQLRADLFKEPEGYLVHGVAKEKWAERNRLRQFREFVDSLSEPIAKYAIVNLAAEMAKKCKEK